jgi:membrane-associated PAP2 superfamily phosphatase
MNRTGLIAALVIAAVSGAVLALYPGIEIGLARHFFDGGVTGHGSFPWGESVAINRVREAGLWIGTGIAALALGALIVKLILPTRKLWISGRAIVFLISTAALGPGLLVNVTLKEHWGRPRPSEIVQFGGPLAYVPWWDPRGACTKNCSFVSGDVSGAIWTMAPAALAPPQWRALAYGASLALGAAMAAIRVSQGGHFLSDVIFSGVFTFLIIWTVHGVIFRWPRTRLSDETIERGMERFTAVIRRILVRLGLRVADEIAGPESGSDDPRLQRRRGWW